MSFSSSEGALPPDFYFSTHRATIGAIMSQIHTMVSSGVFKGIPFMSCEDVDAVLGELQNETLNQLVSKLRGIAGENNHFAHNWQKADLPLVLLPKTLTHILSFAPFNE